MNIDKKTRLELNALSKECFGTASKWQKLVDKGYDELVTELVTETVPAEKEGDEATTREVQVPVRTATGGTQLVRKYYDVNGIYEFMMEHKKRLEVLRAQIQAQREQHLAKQKEELQTKQVHEELSGSAKV